MLQIQDLSVDQEKEPCIGFTQENSIESSVQDCLPYIPRQPCVYLKANIHCAYYMTSSFYLLLSPSMHLVTCDHVM